MPTAKRDERCWDIADRNIARCKKELDEKKGNPGICQDQIDKWLEYRFAHTAEDVAEV